MSEAVAVPPGLLMRTTRAWTRSSSSAFFSSSRTRARSDTPGTVDATRSVAGPRAPQICGDYGAEVIKIEQPGTGDDSRQWAPPVAPDGSAAYFFSINRNKKSVTLNLKHPRGKEILKALVRQADVVIENFKPGTKFSITTSA